MKITPPATSGCPPYRTGITAFCLAAISCIVLTACDPKVAPEEEGPRQYITDDLYTADPAVLVYNEKVYVYTGHDEAAAGSKDYLMKDWYCFSSGDMKTWTNHGALLSYTDFSWCDGRAWAGQVIERNDTFYWYVTVEQASSGGMAIGVASADSPTGPFTDALGGPLITSDMTLFTGQGEWTWDDIDPTVMIDDDDSAYLYFGNTYLKYVKLNDDMTSLNGDIVNVTMPKVSGFGFTEAPWLEKRGELYYLSYAAGWEERIAECVSDSPEGPWSAGELLFGIADNCNTNHPAQLEFNGRRWLFTHDGASNGGDSWHRSVFYEDITSE